MADTEGENLDSSGQDKVVLEDPFVGNVSKLVPLPVDHKGPPKKGYLIFDACFEGGGVNSLPRKHSTDITTFSLTCAGNLGRVDYISDYEYDVFIRPDTCNPRYQSCSLESNPALSF